MMLQIPSVLDKARLRKVKELLSKARFVDGKLSAGMAAKGVKNNEEVAVNDAQVNQLNTIVMGSLVSHPMYKQAALPHRVSAPFYARYRPGMTYGDHVDDPVMGKGEHYRSDVSTTVFLNEPEDYEGGELVVHTAFGEQRVKLAAGDALVYPSASLHHVAEVTTGERIVAVTWAQSMIRDAAKRELLYGLNQARETLLRNNPEAPESKQVDISYANLFRMWAEL